MSLIFNKVYIMNNQIIFYGFLVAIIIMILFAFIMAKKEIKNDNK